MKELIQRIKKNQKTSTILILVLYVSFYFLTQHFPIREVTILKPNFIDLTVPKVPAFIFFYVLSYPLVYVTFFLMRKEEDRFINFYLSFLLVSVVSLFIFFIFPNAIIRNTSWIAQDSVLLTPFKLLWIIDKPSNCFPSLHVSTAFVCCVYLGRVYKAYRWPLLLLAVLIAVSTMLIRQHLFIDVIGGTLLALISFIIPRLRKTYF